MLDRRIKKDIRHLGFAIMVKRQVITKNKHGQKVVVEKFVSVETGLHRDQAYYRAANQYAHLETRIVGVRLDYTPIGFAK